MQLEGAGLVNAYTGTTNINEGTVVLFKTAGVNALPAGAITVGANGPAKIVDRNSNQIADAADLTLTANGTLDLETFSTSETIARLLGAGKVNLGPGSVLTLNSATNGTFSGDIQGAAGSGGITKQGTNTVTLSGVNTYTGTTNITAGTLLLGSDTGLSSGANVTLSGAGVKLSTNGYDGITSGSLNVTANGIIDFGGTTSILSFANNGAWTGILSVWNWNGQPWTTSSSGTEQLFLANSSLTAGQLATINFYSDAGTTQIGTGGAAFLGGTNGELVPVPEANTVGAILLVLGLVGYRERKQLLRRRY